MATEIVKTIQASGGDYTSLQTWEDDITIGMVAADEQWTGKAADEGFGTLAVGGQTVDATHFIKLTTQANASFADDDTNRLDYDTSQGAYATAAPSFAVVFDIQTQYTQIEKMQVECTSSSGQVIVTNTSDCTVQRVIAKGSAFANGGSVLRSIGANDFINCLVISTDTSDAGYGCFNTGSAGNWIHITSVSPSNVTAGTNSFGFNNSYSAALLVNCAAFGWPSGGDYKSSGWSGSSSNNASDGTNAPGANPVDSATYADQFVDVDSTGTMDFKLKSGSALEGAGVQHALSSDLDIFGNARSASTPDIGCHEFVPAAGGTNPHNPLGHPLYGPFGGPIG